MSLTVQTTKLEELRGKLYAKAKTEPAFRFYVLYDKIVRWDTLVEALKKSKAKKGAAGVDGQTFEQIEEYGEERWLRELQRELQGNTYRAEAHQDVAESAGRGEGRGRKISVQRR